MATDLPADFLEECGAIERTIRRLMDLTHGPGPGLEYQHEVLVAARRYRAVRDQLIGLYIPPRPA
jgi:hypothetical protein